jgi:hypothetical protein
MPFSTSSLLMAPVIGFSVGEYLLYLFSSLLMMHNSWWVAVSLTILRPADDSYLCFLECECLPFYMLCLIVIPIC